MDEDYQLTVTITCPICRTKITGTPDQNQKHINTCTKKKKNEN